MNNYKLSMNKAKRFLTLLFVICSLLFVIGCEDSITLKNNLSDIPAGKGSFSLTLSNARTILPNTPNLSDFLMYNLSFTPVNGGSAETADRTNSNLTTNPILLDPGTYDIVVNAYKDVAKTKLLARGTLDDIVITTGQNTSAAVTLEALLSSGTGTFSWNITFPSGVTLTTRTMTITPASSGGTSQQTVTLSTATGNRILNSGTYNLTFNLARDDGKKVVWKELLYVYQNLESNFTFTFTSDHFNDPNYNVTYNFNDDVTSNLTQSVLHGDKLTPTAPTKGGYVFGGWYTDNVTFANPYDFNTNIIESFNLYAKWNYVSLEALTGLAEKLAWLQAHAQTGGSYILEVSADESIAPHTLSYSDRNNITITLTGVGANQTIGLSSNGAMFTVGSGISLILDNDITLQGRDNNNNSLVRVNSGGTLTMNANSTITGNYISRSQYNNGGGVYMDNNATFTMNGGEISNNTVDPLLHSAYGGGVYVGSGNFTMNSGEIIRNTLSYYAVSGAYNDSYFYGGGVYVNGGNINMNGGTISNNNANSRGSFGGGVYVGNGTFTMSTGIISSNASNNGGGVFITNGTFTMDGGTISSNRGHGSELVGVGVCVESGIFTMSDGTISNSNINITSSITSGFTSFRAYGGGVYVNQHGTFTMDGGTIADNNFFVNVTKNMSPSVEIVGGGVCVGNSGTFILNSGTISGNNISSSVSCPNPGNSSQVTASAVGGGVYVSGTFTMNGGEIFNNTVVSSASNVSSTYTINQAFGGGVYVGGGNFSKNDGIITGYDDDVISGNRANMGHAVYATDNGSSTVKRKENTAGTKANLSFNGTIRPTTWSGDWDY